MQKYTKYRNFMRIYSYDGNGGSWLDVFFVAVNATIQGQAFQKTQRQDLEILQGS